MRSPIIPRQDPTTTPAEGTTQISTPTSDVQSPEETTTLRTSNPPSQTTPTPSSTGNSTPTSTRTTPTTANEPTSTQQISTSTPTQSATSRTETSEPQTSTSSPNTSTSPTSQSTTPSASVTATQSEITSTSFLSITSTPPTVSSTSTSISLSTTSILSSSALDTQTSSPTSISSSTADRSTSPTSSPIITTSASGSDTSNAAPTPTPAPSPTPTSSTTPVRESSTASESASSTLTSVLITTVTTVNGQPTTLTTVVPTLATSPQESSGISARSSKIVGGVVGGTLALLGVLLALFYVSRRRRKVAAVRDAPRLQAPRQMLDADDFDLAEPGPAPYAYGMVGARANPNASGSIFHEALPGTSSQPSHSYSRSVVSENDPLLAHHMRGGSADIDSVTTSSPRESTHFRASSTTGLLYDPNDPFGDHPPQSVGSSSSRPHPLAVNKALEARSRGSDQHIYPPSAYRGPTNTSDPLSTSSPVLVHQDAGRVDMDTSAPPAYGNTPR